MNKIKRKINEYKAELTLIALLFIFNILLVVIIKLGL